MEQRSVWMPPSEKKKILSLTKTLMFQMHFILLAVKKAKGLKIKGKDGKLHYITQI